MIRRCHSFQQWQSIHFKYLNFRLLHYKIELAKRSSANMPALNGENDMAEMIYRTLPRGGEKISIIGLGMGSIHESGESEIENTVRYAIEKGVNYFDMVASEAKPYAPYARAIKDNRSRVLLQMHFGALYDGGTYGWTRDVKKIKNAFESQLKLLQTDYTDFGFVHCIDEEDDYDDVMRKNGIWDYLRSLKEAGVIRHLGLSSHDPDIIRRFLDLDLIDMVMFSINPAYDYSTGTYGIGTSEQRSRLYRDCESAGVGISVMKPFGGGQLLNAKTSPFGQALSEHQCMQYALDRPGVLTVLPGIRGKRDLDKIFSFLDATQEQRDYSVIGRFAPQNAVGNCVYCNHCQPCPAGINIGLVNKYYDLALAGDELAKGHYQKLSVNASACLHCGHCESRCPFSVKQERRMDEINAYFTK